MRKFADDHIFSFVRSSAQEGSFVFIHSIKCASCGRAHFFIRSIKRERRLICFHPFDQVRKFPDWRIFSSVRSSAQEGSFVFIRSIKCARRRKFVEGFHPFDQVRNMSPHICFFHRVCTAPFDQVRKKRAFFSSVRSYVSPHLFYVCSLRSSETFVFTFVFWEMICL